MQSSPSPQKSKNARKRSLLKTPSSPQPVDSNFDWKHELDTVEKKWNASKGSNLSKNNISSALSLSSFPRNSLGTDVSVHAIEIVDYLSPFLMRLKSSGGKFSGGISNMHSGFSETVTTQIGKTLEIKRLLNLEKLFLATIELDLPLSLILEYNNMEEDDPRVFQYRQHPIWGT